MVAQVNGTSHTATELEGRVVRTNDHGLMLDGRASWLNYSKFGSFREPLPQPGDVVKLVLDKAGFIRAVEPLAPAQPAPRQLRSVEAQEAPVAAPSKDTTITRLAVLKAAAQFCQYRQDATPDDVLDIASQWETWVTR